MTTLLTALYKEHRELQNSIKELTIKLKQVSDLIISYGGVLTDSTEEPDNIYETDRAVNLIGDYPHSGTWKEKILFILKHQDQPVTANEVAEIIIANERSVTPKKAHSTATLYLSTMANKETEPVGADKSGFKSKYYLK